MRTIVPIEEHLAFGDDGQPVAYGFDSDSGQWTEAAPNPVFGRQASASEIGNPILFTGREYDAETGLDQHRTRAYHAGLG